MAVAAEPGDDLSAALIELLGPDGTTVLATATTNPLGQPATNFDQAILGYVPTVPGRYTLRVISDEPAQYGVLVTGSLHFEAEPNDQIGGTPRDLNDSRSALGFLGSGDSGGGTASTRLFAVVANTSQVVEYDPETGAELNRFALPEPATGEPDALAFDGTSLFYAEGPQFAGSGIFYELDPDTGAVIDSDSFGSLGLSSAIDGLGAYGGLIFASDTLTSQLFFIDPETDTVVGTTFAAVTIRGGAAGAGARGSIFVNDFFAGAIYEINPSTGQVMHTLPAPTSSVYGLAYVSGSLYTGSGTSGQIFELDPDTGAVLNTWQATGIVSALGGDDASGTPPSFASSFVPGVPAPSDENSGVLTYGLGATGSGAGSGSTTTLDVDVSSLDNDDPLAAVVGPELAHLARSGGGAGGTSEAEPPLFVGALDLVQIIDDFVIVEAVAASETASLWGDLLELGLTHASSFGRIISGWLPIGAIADMASLATLKFARPAYRPITSVGLTTSQADRAMQADTARAAFGVDGAGVTVGVLSDSFGSAFNDVLTGDLPGAGNPLGHTTPVNVLADASGSDEGRAMLQLIHDVAPGAALAFHTAFNGQADFANGILELQSIAGADVIVDDVIYFAEPMFQDGVIAQAIDTVVANGATYFSSAGNNARDSWEGAYRPSGTFLSGRQLHDYDPGAGVDTFQSITVPVGSSILMSFQWDSPFFSVSGGAGSPNDVDIFILDSSGTSILASATTGNLGNDALEVLSFTNFSGSSQVNVAIGLASGAAPGLMKWIGFGEPTVNQFATNSATAYGHSNAAGASSVGAADYRATPQFGTNPPLLESFSSAGGIPILFDTSGNPVFELRQKPNIVAPDGTNTTFFGNDVEGDGFPNFFGTSAAAPHAGAVAALMKQLTPFATPAEIYAAMTGSTIDMDDPATPGFDVGFDTGTGYGLINAVGALTLIQVDPILVGPRIIGITPPAGVSHDLDITSATLTFSEQLAAAQAGNAASYRLLEAGPNGSFENGAGDDIVIPVTPLFDGDRTVELSIRDGATPLGFGKFQLTIFGNSIVDLDGNPLNSISGPTGGSDTVHQFDVVFEVPRGGDFYRLDLVIGDQVTLTTRTPLADPAATPLNDLDPQIVVYGPSGTLVAVDSDSADGKNAEATFLALVDGTYYVQVVAESGGGEYLLDVERTTLLLAGDYNRNGRVETSDYTVWRDHLGQNVPAFDLADGDGDGVIGQADYNLWKSNFGTSFATAASEDVIVLGGGGGGAIVAAQDVADVLATPQVSAVIAVSDGSASNSADTPEPAPAAPIAATARKEAFDRFGLGFAGTSGNPRILAAGHVRRDAVLGELSHTRRLPRAVSLLLAADRYFERLAASADGGKELCGANRSHWLDEDADSLDAFGAEAETAGPSSVLFRRLDVKLASRA